MRSVENPGDPTPRYYLKVTLPKVTAARRALRDISQMWISQQTLTSPEALSIGTFCFGALGFSPALVPAFFRACWILPDGVENALGIESAVGMRPEIITLGLNKIGREALGAHAVVIGQ